MPTDKERREVARRLRERAGKRILNLGELLWCIGCDEGDDAAAWNRLADLIEPSDSAQTVAEDIFGQMRHSTEQERIAYADMMARNSVELHTVDRGALLRLARYMDKDVAETEAHFSNVISTKSVSDYARRIREALGVGR